MRLNEFWDGLANVQGFIYHSSTELMKLICLCNWHTNFLYKHVGRAHDISSGFKCALWKRLQMNLFCGRIRQKLIKMLNQFTPVRLIHLHYGSYYTLCSGNSQKLHVRHSFVGICHTLPGIQFPRLLSSEGEPRRPGPWPSPSLPAGPALPRAWVRLPHQSGGSERT